MKNLAKDTEFKCSDLCTPTCPYRLARLGTSLRVRGKLTLKKKEIIVWWFYIRFCRYSLPDSSLRVRLYFSVHHHSDIARRSRMTARVNSLSRSSKWLLPKKKKIRTESRPRLTGKVSTDRLTKGANWSRNERIENTSEQKQKTALTERIFLGRLFVIF